MHRKVTLSCEETIIKNVIMYLGKKEEEEKVSLLSSGLALNKYCST